MIDDYGSPLALTSQFRFCGNPFRLDFYKFVALVVNIVLLAT